MKEQCKSHREIPHQTEQTRMGETVSLFLGKTVFTVPRVLELTFPDGGLKKHSLTLVCRLPPESLKSLKREFPNDKSKCSRKPNHLAYSEESIKSHPCPQTKLSWWFVKG